MAGLVAVLLPYFGRSAIEQLSASEKHVSLLQEAVKRSNGRHSFQTIVEELASGAAMLWTRKNSLIVTQTTRYPTGAVWLSVRVGCGHMLTLKKMMGGLEDYARENGMSGVESVARLGWARVGKPMGYENTHTFLEKRF